MVDVYLCNFRNAQNMEEVVQHICSVIEASDIYAFAQFLAEPSVQALQNDPNYFKYYNLLYLFAYGKLIYQHFKCEQNFNGETAPDGYLLGTRNL